MKTLQLPKHQGRLRLFDIRNKMKSLKIQWINKIVSNTYFKECFKLSFPKSKYENFWLCNISKEDIPKLECKDTMIFWKQILEFWCNFNFYDPQNRENVQEQIL